MRTYDDTFSATKIYPGKVSPILPLCGNLTPDYFHDFFQMMRTGLKGKTERLTYMVKSTGQALRPW